MSDPTGHDTVREMLALDALDALSPEERAQLDRHLTTCEDCRRELGALRDATGSLAASLPPRPMPVERAAAMRARLMSRAIEDRAGVIPLRPRPDDERGVTSPSPANAASAGRPTFARWLAAAAIVLAMGILAHDVSRGMVIRRLSVARAQLRDSTSALEHRLADQQAIVDGLTGPGVRVMDAGATNARQPFGRMFWDQPTNRWTFVAYNLPATAAGHTYQLWLVTRDQKKVSAGTFDPGANGSAIVRATYALAPDALAAIAVTNEPAGGSPQPTTTPILVGPTAKTD